MSKTFLAKIYEINKLTENELFDKYYDGLHEEIFAYTENFEYRNYKFKLSIIVNVNDINSNRIASYDCENMEIELWEYYDCHSFFLDWIDLNKNGYYYLINRIHEDIDIFLDKSLPDIDESIESLKNKRKLFENKINEINNR